MKSTPAENKIEHAAEIARTLIAEQVAANVKTIASAVDEAAKLLASANESAVKLLASNAAEAAKVLSIRGTDDHDLMLELKTEFRIEMKGLKADIKDLKDGTTAKIESHDSRLDKLESWRVTLDGKEGAAARFTLIENANLAFSTQVKTWIVAAGLVCSIIVILVNKFL